MPKLLTRPIRWIFRKFIIPLKKKQYKPEYVARTTAVGIGCGLFPIIGQSYLCFLIWLLMAKLLKKDFNLLMGCAWSFISNPFTTVPFFYSFYLVGSLILGMPERDYSDFAESFTNLFNEEFDLSLFLRSGIYGFLVNIQLPMIIGSIPFIITGSWLGYKISYKLAVKWEKRRGLNKLKSKIHNLNDKIKTKIKTKLKATKSSKPYKKLSSLVRHKQRSSNPQEDNGKSDA